MQESYSFTRRDFLKGMGLTSLAIATGACESCYNKIKDRPTRRNIANLAANDPIIQTYRDAVSKMQALPPGDGRNWTKQAEIHNNHCVHGNWWFLPWHRAYLFYFEAICRKLTGKTISLCLTGTGPQARAFRRRSGETEIHYSTTRALRLRRVR